MGNGYRPRTARSSPLWQCVQASLRDFIEQYPERYQKHLGPIRPEWESTFNNYLRCGDLSQGFLRIRCQQCDHDYLLPFTCKQRGICPTCHQRRTLEKGKSLAEEICVYVPHRHWVFTIPKVIRNVFRKHPKRLSILCRMVAEVLTECMRHATGMPDGKVGIVLGIHTFGDYLAYHPHIHCLATAGCFDAEGNFLLASRVSLKPFREAFRHGMLDALVERKWMSPRQRQKLLGWRNSGFNIDPGETVLGATDSRARQRLAEYLLRAPFSLQKMSWNAQTKTVLYRSSRSWKTKRNFELFSGAGFIAALAEHIPHKGFQTLRYYGYYSNKSRGLRKRTQACEAPSILKTTAVCPTRTSWRDLILRIWGYDPLRCPCCGGLMRVISSCQSPLRAREILEPLGLWEPIEFISASAPRAPPPIVRWMVSAEDGSYYSLDLDQDSRRMPDHPPVPWPKERFPREFSEEETSPSLQKASHQPEEIPLDDGMILVLEDEDPWAHDTDPVFWTD